MIHVPGQFSERVELVQCKLKGRDRVHGTDDLSSHANTALLYRLQVFDAAVTTAKTKQAKEKKREGQINEPLSMCWPIWVVTKGQPIDSKTGRDSRGPLVRTAVAR